MLSTSQRDPLDIRYLATKEFHVLSKVRGYCGGRVEFELVDKIFLV